MVLKLFRILQWRINEGIFIDFILPYSILFYFKSATCVTAVTIKNVTTELLFYVKKSNI